MQAQVMNAATVEAQPKPSSSAQTLQSLLDANLNLPPEYRGGLSNHLPMALQALQSLGAGAERMQAFHATYSQRFERRKALPLAEPAADWRLLRGQGDERTHASLVATFEQAIAREGESVVLRRLLPDLLQGVAGAAFHGVIRTAHAVQSGHRGELARALAYWAWRWQDLTLPDPVGVPLTFEDWSERLVNESSPERFAAPSISRRMALATASPVYLSLGAALAPQADLLQCLAGLALGTYLKSGNFTVLHMITGLRAVRVLLPWVEDAQALHPIIVRAFTAAYLAAQIKPMAMQPVSASPSWPDVIAAAIASDDDHVIKLVHACREEFSAYGDARYLEAAALATA